MIIVEGVDNTGKTTLVKELINRIPQLKLAPRNASLPGTKETLTKYFDLYMDLDPKETLNLVFDRFTIPSEDVYGPVLRGKNAFTLAEWTWMEAKFRLHRPLVILCHRPIMQIMETIDERDQMEGVKDNVEKLARRYLDVLLDLDLDWFWMYNYETSPFQTLEEVVLSYLEVEKRRRDVQTDRFY